MAMDLFYKAAGAVIAPFRYAEREVKNLKENIKEDAQEAMAGLLKMAVVVFCSLLFLLFISITAAIAINRSMDNDLAGFAIVAGFYLLVGIIMYVWNASDKHKMEHTKNQLSRNAT
jgi:cbb3-type cytochrome oxidase subunit 3